MTVSILQRKMERVRRRVQGLACERVCRRQADPLAGNSKTIVTTFYDVEGDYAMPGQSRASINALGRILEIEAVYGIQSTFNIVARFASDISDLIPTILRGGHEIASHSYDHTVLNRLSNKQLSDNVRRCREIFGELGVSIHGHRSPQSAWNWKLMSILANEGYSWNAEDGREPHPYRIPSRTGTSFWRFPVTDDDWYYERDRFSPGQVLSIWKDQIGRARRHRQYTAIGFHPWVEASDERLTILEEFLHWLSEQEDIEILPFGKVLSLIQGGLSAD